METTIIWQAMSFATFAMVAFLVYRSIKASRRDTNTSVFVDTSVLIDARIVSIAKTGFVPGTLIIPRSVIGELQFMADKADNDKREKARRGLDVIKELQDIDTIGVEILQDGSHAREGVDERLLALAKDRGGYLCTVDYNLIKVAEVEGLRVLNVNELAQQIRMVYLPGDMITLTLAQKGQDAHQAVGHLDDGTMVVVENASAHIGKTLEVTVVRSLQTSAGRMIFAKRRDGGDQGNRKQKSSGRQTVQKSNSRPKQSMQPKSSSSPRSKKVLSKPTKEVSKVSSQPQQKPQRRAYHASPRQRRSAEDAMVDLANQS